MPVAHGPFKSHAIHCMPDLLFYGIVVFLMEDCRPFFTNSRQFFTLVPERSCKSGTQPYIPRFSHIPEPETVRSQFVDQIEYRIPFPDNSIAFLFYPIHGSLKYHLSPGF